MLGSADTSGAPALGSMVAAWGMDWHTTRERGGGRTGPLHIFGCICLPVRTLGCSAPHRAFFQPGRAAHTFVRFLRAPPWREPRSLLLWGWGRGETETKSGVGNDSQRHHLGPRQDLRRILQSWADAARSRRRSASVVVGFLVDFWAMCADVSGGGGKR